jgi:hypothetical protein
LVITGTDDNDYMPHGNALVLAGKIPWGMACTDQRCWSCSNESISR